jgi:hypothetical protein
MNFNYEKDPPKGGYTTVSELETFIKNEEVKWLDD